MTSDEEKLLRWLGEEDASQYGECYGPTLDSLIARGLAVVGGPETGVQNTFIAKGSNIMYRSVTLTDQGRVVLNKLKEGRAT